MAKGTELATNRNQTSWEDAPPNLLELLIWLVLRPIGERGHGARSLGGEPSQVLRWAMKEAARTETKSFCPTESGTVGNLVNIFAILIH